jgi:hypothetical protein
MVLFLLYMKAELENVSSISLKKDENLCLTVKNPLSDYEVREKVVMNPSESVEQAEGSRVAEHHFSLKWEGCKKASTLTFLTAAEVKTALKKKKKIELPRDYTADDSGNFVPIFAMECRGLEPTAFFPMGDEVIVTSEGGAEFNSDVDLSEGDWGDYDEENDQPVSISDVEFKWESV